MMLLSSTGVEKFLQFGWPEGQTTWLAVVGNAEVKFTVLCIIASPAGWLVELMTENPVQLGFVVGSQPGGGTLASGAPSVLKSTPAVAVESLETTVLLMNSTLTASWSETPPPVQPATLSTMMLLVTSTSCHLPGDLGLRCTSVPLTFCSRRPPPLPLSAVLPWTRLALKTRPGPPPWVVSVELKLWLKRNELCSISAFQLKPL